MCPCRVSGVCSSTRWLISQILKRWSRCQQPTPCWRLFVKVKDQRPNDKTMCEMDHTNGSSFSHSFSKINYPQITTASLSWEQCSGFLSFFSEWLDLVPHWLWSAHSRSVLHYWWRMRFCNLFDWVNKYQLTPASQRTDGSLWEGAYMFTIFHYVW